MIRSADSMAAQTVFRWADWSDEQLAGRWAVQTALRKVVLSAERWAVRTVAGMVWTKVGLLDEHWADQKAFSTAGLSVNNWVA